MKTRDARILTVVALSLTLMSVGLEPGGATFAGSPGRIFMTCGPGICSVNPDGSDRNVVYESRGFVSDIAVSPDGRKIAMIDANTLRVMDADGSDPQDLAVVAATAVFSSGRVSWGPDGRIVFYPHQLRIPYSIDSDGGNVRRVLSVWRQALELAVSPDGTKLAYLRPVRTESNQALAVAALDGSNERSLFQQASIDRFDWSPDGSQIVTRDDQREGVLVVDVNGNSTRLIPGSELDEYPRWAPDMSKLLVSRYEPDQLERFWTTINLDGTNEMTVTEAVRSGSGSSAPGISVWQAVCGSTCTSVADQRARTATQLTIEVPTQEPFNDTMIPVTGELRPSIPGMTVTMTMVDNSRPWVEQVLGSKQVVVEDDGSFYAELKNPFLREHEPLSGECRIFVEYLAEEENYAYSAVTDTVHCTKKPSKITVTASRLKSGRNERGGNDYWVNFSGRVLPPLAGRVVLTVSRSARSKSLFKSNPILTGRGTYATKWSLGHLGLPDACDNGGCVLKARFPGNAEYLPSTVERSCCEH